MRGPGNANTKELRKDSIVRGHHVYKLLAKNCIYVEPEESKEHDEYAVAVRKNDEMVGHAPRSFSRILWYFLKHAGEIKCVIPGVKSDPGVYFLCLCVAPGVNLRPCIYLSPAF